MRQLLGQVLALQPNWTSKNTPDMARRGVLIRKEIPSWLREHLGAFRVSVGPAGSDLDIQGRDGTGQKSEIPWVRIFSKSRSPNAHHGWYVVYLFKADGSGAYLSLAHAATRYENGEFVPRPSEELLEYVSWARSFLSNKFRALDGLSFDVQLSASGNLGRSYEQCAVVSYYYPIDSTPSETSLLDHLHSMLEALGELYDEDDLGRSPGSSTREAEAVQKAVEQTFSPPDIVANTGQGFGLTAEERSAVERWAMLVAREHLAKLGFEVEDVSKKESFDFKAKKDLRSIIVEVKGTTGGLASIIITAKEVAAHRRMYPENALIVVHSIELDRRSKPPAAFGGTLHDITPWSIDPSGLRPLAYQYTIVSPSGKKP